MKRESGSNPEQPPLLYLMGTKGADAIEAHALRRPAFFRSWAAGIISQENSRDFVR
jgi:hypothetical protein